MIPAENSMDIPRENMDYLPTRWDALDDTVDDHIR